MQAIYHDKSNLGGVYRIVNLKTGKFYYGSTALFRKRFKSHKATLEAGTHTNIFMLNEYKKHGPDGFVFEVIEEVEDSLTRRLAAEQVYLDKYYDSQKECMNLRNQACDSRTGKRANEPVNRLTDKRCKSPTAVVKAKRAQASAIEKRTPEARARAAENCKNGMWAGHSAGVTLVNVATQETVEVTGSLREFALQRGLSYKALHLMVRGKTKSSGGWKVK